MGASADAVLFYGYVWDTEDVEFEPDLDSIIDAQITETGVYDPWKDRPEGLTHVQHQQWMLENSSELEVYYAARRRLDDAIPVDWGNYGNLEYDYSKPYLYAKGSDRNTYSGPLEIDPLTITTNPEWAQQLNEFLEAQDIEKPHPRPGWFIVANYG
jgi:hypothetical protein